MSLKFSQLPVLTSVNGNIIVPIVSPAGPTSYTTTVDDIGAYLLAGNAATATKLQTPRTINGVAFDGTANILITTALAVATTSTLGGVIPDGTTITVSGTGVISGPSTMVHAFSFDANNNLIYTQTANQAFAYTTDGLHSPYAMVDIGTNAYAYSLDSNGNLIATFTS